MCACRLSSSCDCHHVERAESGISRPVALRQLQTLPVDFERTGLPMAAKGLNGKQTSLQPSFDCANEPHPREFPTTCASWSKPNVESCIFCVNAARHNSSFVLLMRIRTGRMRPERRKSVC